jgi:hypothetical protein
VDKLRKFHLAMMALWSLLVIPTLLWWKDSILWVALMSIYACIEGHFASYQGARAEKKADEANGGPGS